MTCQLFLFHTKCCLLSVIGRDLLMYMDFHIFSYDFGKYARDSILGTSASLPGSEVIPLQCQNKSLDAWWCFGK